MYQNNPMMQYFEQFGEVLTRLFDYKQQGTFEEADELLNVSFARFLSIKPDAFDGVLAQRVIDYLLANYTYNTTQLSILAELLKERGEISGLKGDDQQTMFNYQVALNILEFVEHEERVYSLARMEKIIWLQYEIAAMLNKVC
ncbi:MAG: hypothetical protein ACOC31_00500 [Bacteroidota bacterium]